MRKREYRAAVKRAAKSAGGWAELARHLGMTRQRVFAWQKVPVEDSVAITVSELTGIPLHELRPDIYPLELQDMKR